METTENKVNDITNTCTLSVAVYNGIGLIDVDNESFMDEMPVKSLMSLKIRNCEGAETESPWEF